MYIWNVAADLYGFSDSRIMEMVYETPAIRQFLDSDYSMGISACKGMGKTFLLKAKRLKTMEDASYLILPRDQMVDTPGPINLNGNQVNYLSSYRNWVSLWSFCICAYVISQDEFADLRQDPAINCIPKDITNIINSKNDGVFYVLSRIITSGSNALLGNAVKYSSIFFSLCQRINRQIVLFVDKIEEPFNRGYYKIPGSTSSTEGRYNNSIWAYAQLAFAEAVYSLYSGRHHLKIYYTIRQEALYGGGSITPEFSKIQQMIAKIEYDSLDLQKMFNHYIELENEENLMFPEQKYLNPGKALCGVSRIKHRSGKYESLWAYIYRHSLGRPRDIMEMAISLYENIVAKEEKKKLNHSEMVRQCRHWINEISTRICKEYLFVLEPFMSIDDCIAFSQSLLEFLSTLPTNVFTTDSIVQYCHNANGLPSSKCSNCHHTHYFSALYNIGLMGYIYKSASESGYKNEIKAIGDSIFSLEMQSLPSAELYYVHPGIGNIIKEERLKRMQNYVSSNIIINSSETFVNADQVMRLKHLSAALLGNNYEKRVFITSTERDMKDIRKFVCELLSNRGYEVFAFEESSFPRMSAGRNKKGATHDHCIDVALSCSHLIYIVGGTFGGQYAGTDYERYYVERQDTIGFIPSVSFMEYLVAKKYDKDVQVYISRDVDTARSEYLANGAPDAYNSHFVESKNAAKVFKQIGWFNKLGNGTWYDKYSDLNQLQKYLEAKFPSRNEQD